MNDRPTDPTAYAIAIAAGLAAEWRRLAAEYREMARARLKTDPQSALVLTARAEQLDDDHDALMALDLGPPEPAETAVCDGCGATGPTDDRGKIAIHRAQNDRVCPGSGLPPREPDPGSEPVSYPAVRDSAGHMPCPACLVPMTCGGAYGAPGRGDSWHCPIGHSWARVGGRYYLPSDGAHIMRPEDVR